MHETDPNDTVIPEEESQSLPYQEEGDALFDPNTIDIEKTPITPEFHKNFGNLLPQNAVFMTYDKSSTPPEIHFYDKQGRRMLVNGDAHSRVLLLKLTETSSDYVKFMSGIKTHKK